MNFNKLALVFLFLTSSCATLFSDSADEITFTSKPEKALVLLNGKEIGRTPLKYTLDRDTFSKRVVVFKIDGYKSQQVTVQKSFNSTAILNLISWPSWATDALSGNVIQYSPTAYYVELESEEGKTSAKVDMEMRFLANHYQQILIDIARGDGSHLKTYFEMQNEKSNAPKIKYSEFQKRVKNKSETLLTHEYPNRLHEDLSGLISL